MVGRLLVREPRSPDGEATEGSGLYMYTSPDGLRWTLHPKRVFPFDPDTLNMAIYDDRTGKYLAYVRTWNPLRRVGVVELDDLMKIQIREYMAFIKDFTSRANIMTKNFFIVVPYDPAIINRGGGVGGALGSIFPSKGGGSTNLTNEQFEQYRTQLEQRISVIEQGLVRTGVRIVSLGTEEVIELFYKLFNPGELEKPLQVTQIAK